MSREQLPYQDRREQSRALCADMVKLEWREGGRWHRYTHGVLEDISARGACVQLELPVEQGTEARLTTEDGWTAVCQVSYCKYQEIGYFVGLTFDGDTQWDAGSFLPRHLLSFAQMSAAANLAENVPNSTATH